MRTPIRNQGSIRHMFIVAYRPLLVPMRGGKNLKRIITRPHQDTLER